ncbi:hypothetical protein Moror_6667 [Moniliophthora roreri MCA 2997]|uniref:Uncharacterized protein n=1 Tax=Moniliophthora roreri (strain MCA 2997) TaxID=1381753 RepID=V2XW64_MONRO|nr:hypothetical protein Moror_6667 [Moniliophthora roreri MCA 2997]
MPSRILEPGNAGSMARCMHTFETLVKSVKPIRISALVDLDGLFKQAFDSEHIDEDDLLESPLSSVPSSPLSSAPPTPKLNPDIALPEVNIQLVSSGAVPMAVPSHSKRQSKANKKRKCAENKWSSREYKPPPGTKKRHIEPSLTRVKVVDVDLSKIRVADNGFTGYHADPSLH